MPLFAICIISIILMLLLQRADLEIIKADRTRVYLGLTFFKYKIPTDKKKGGIRESLRFLRLRIPLYRAFNFILPRCDVKVCERLLPTDAPGELSSFVFLPFYFTVYSLFAFAKSRAKSFIIDKDGPADNISLHIRIKFRLIFLIISALIFLYYYIVTRLKESLKNV